MTKQHFYHPKFIPTWFLIFLMRIFAQFPIFLQVFLGEILGILLRILLTRKYNIALINIQKCFPEKNKTQIKKLVKQHFSALGMSFFEMSSCFYLGDKRLKKRYKIEGCSHLQHALDENKNILLLVGHLTTMMLAGRMLLQNFAFADVYRPQNNALFDFEMHRVFEKHGATMLSVKDLKGLVKTLKSGVPIWYAFDQDLGGKNSIFAPFFNIQTATIQAPAKLTKNENTQALAVSFMRKNNQYHLKISPPLENYPNNTPLESATRLNAILETQIQQAPEQYLWIHRRFKTRPNHEKSFY
jgi:lipid A biosynthesis lauroyl/palmitoleoyl acyltransferase